MEIKKETLHLQESSFRTGSNVMVEGDIILPDIKPDIREILLVDAKVQKHAEEIRGGKLYVTGNVQFHMLYAPDSNESELKSFEAVLPFSDSVDIPDEDLSYTVRAATEHIGFSQVNSRKLSAKIIVSIQVRGLSVLDITPITSVADHTIQRRAEEYHVFVPLCEAKSDIVLSDLLTVSPHMPDIDEILKTEATVSDTDYKVMNGKVLIRGTLCLHTLYTAANEAASAEQITHNIPFSEMLEAEYVDENSRVFLSFCVKDLTATPRGDMNGDTKIISLDATVGVCLNGSTSAHVTLIDDCYSTCGTLSCDKETAVLYEPMLLESSSFTEQQKAAIPAGVKAGAVLSSSAKPVLKECSFSDGAMHIKGALVTFLLLRDDQGTVRSAVTETPFERVKPMSGDSLSADCVLWAEQTEAQVMGDGSVEICVTMRYHTTVLKFREVTYIVSCDRQDDESNGKTQPAIVIYFTEEGDTLWNIAKKYGTTVENIQSANDLESDALSIGQKLFIPKIL
ncbi:MAG: DUF3794 domain-containing protein [Clostridia bacterium]|nr:DUF3794 domain-containing protein [Clostridia bacterium]